MYLYVLHPKYFNNIVFSVICIFFFLQRMYIVFLFLFLQNKLTNQPKNKLIQNVY